MFNTWKMTEEVLSDPNNVLEVFSTQLEFRDNFTDPQTGVPEVKTGGIRDLIDESVLRYRTKAAKCNFKTEESLEERIVEVLIAGIKRPEVQKILLSKYVHLKLDEAASLARTHEASDSHMSQLNSLDRALVHYVHQQEARGTCKKCGLRHPPKKCPAFISQCHKCGTKGHWNKQCRFSSDSKQKRNFSKEFASYCQFRG